MVRVKLTFEVHANSALPLHYQYPISSWIYKVIARADADFATWLHDKGYAEKGQRSYRLFTFAPLFVHPYEIREKAGIIISKGRKVSLQLAFFGDEVVQNFVTGLFKNQVFRIGDPKVPAKALKVSNVEVLAKPKFKETMRFRTLSPICMSAKAADGSEDYLSPKDASYEQALYEHLIRKWLQVASFFPKHFSGMSPSDALEWRLLGTYCKPKLIHIKAHTSQETKIKGYHHSFELTAPKPLMELIYYGGLGKSTSQGFGMVDVVG